MEFGYPYNINERQPLNDTYEKLPDLFKEILPDVKINKAFTKEEIDNLANLAESIRQAITFDEIKDLATNGDVGAQLELANMFYHGEKVPKNNELANYWYKRVALSYKNTIFEYEKSDKKDSLIEKQYMEALVNLAHMYREGLGIQKNDIMSIKYYKKAAKEGDAYAQYMMGKMYLDGYSIIEKDVNKAIKYFSKSAQDYNKSALNELINIADNGNEKAQFILGTMYCDGNGVIEDFYESLKWLIKAAEQGNEDAEEIITKILPLKMTEKLCEDDDVYAKFFVKNLAENLN